MSNYEEVSNYEEEMIKKSMKKNQEELDKLCNRVCLCIGWFLVICLFVHTIYIIYKH